MLLDVYQRNSRSQFSFRETNCEISLPPLVVMPQWLQDARAGPNLVRQKLNLLSSSFSTLHPIPHAPTDHQFWWALWLCQEWKILARFLSTLKYFPAKVSSVRFVVKFQRFQPLMNESLSPNLIISWRSFFQVIWNVTVIYRLKEMFTVYLQGYEVPIQFSQQNLYCGVSSRARRTV